MANYNKYNKEETIKRHREMWNWIADQVETGKITGDKDVSPTIHELKGLAIKTLHPEDDGKLLANCYLCDYAYYALRRMIRQPTNSSKKLNIVELVETRCHFCPLGYTETTSIDRCLNYNYFRIKVLFDFICYDDRRSEFVGLAREIANLPEREINENEEDQNE